VTCIDSSSLAVPKGSTCSQLLATDTSVKMTTYNYRLSLFIKDDYVITAIYKYKWNANNTVTAYMDCNTRDKCVAHSQRLSDKLSLTR